MAEPKVAPDEPFADEDHAKRTAAARKLAFDRTVANATVKSSALERKLLATFAVGTANWMLARILSGEIEPKDAKQAAEIAKIALDIARTETGEGDIRPEDMTTDERKLKIAQAQALAAEVMARGRQIAEQTPAEAGLPVPSVPELRVVEDDASGE
jgi:hypothetical protein